MGLNGASTIYFIALLAILAGVVFWVVFWPSLRRRRVLARPFPAAWQQILERRLPFFGKMPRAMQVELQNLIKLFLADKRFVGCGGLTVDDEMRITIAAQACLLLLNRGNGVYPQLRTVLVYPTTFIVRRDVEDEYGLVSADHAELLGESWEQGKVVLAWDSVDKGVRDPNDGYNVVLHEFAHQLDHESGATNGAPLLHTPGAYRSWAKVLSSEFEALQEQAIHGHETLMDDYGASNPAEFFAVATETFFERPNEMREGHTELFEELVNFYRVDPSQWVGQ